MPRRLVAHGPPRRVRIRRRPVPRAEANASLSGPLQHRQVRFDSSFPRTMGETIVPPPLPPRRVTGEVTGKAEGGQRIDEVGPIGDDSLQLLPRLEDVSILQEHPGEPIPD